jgi:phospholipid/cholesterol/gamma-HCH transport system substrate-binding protein
MTNPVKRKPVKPPPRSEFVTIASIGLLLTAVVGYLVWTGLKEPFIIKTKFDFADGLKPGAEVQIAGIKVGSVKEIKFVDVPANKSSKEIFEVWFEIDPKINNVPAGEMIRKDAVAVLIVTGALGDRSIDIVPGSASAPPIRSGEYINSRIEPTVSMVMDNYESMNNNFDSVRLIIEKSIDNINNGRGNVGRFSTKEVNRNLEQLAKDTELLQKELESGKGTIGRFNSDKRLKQSYDRLLDLTEKLRRNFEQGQGTIGKFANDKEFQQRLDLTEARATKLSNTFDRIMVKTEKGQGSLANFNKNEQFKREFNQLKQSAENISNTIAGKKGTAGLLINDTRLTENIASISTETMKLIYDIREKPRKYIKFTLF